MQKEQFENKVTQCINCLENNQHFLFSIIVQTDN